jgi:hypothetical protein
MKKLYSVALFTILVCFLSCQRDMDLQLKDSGMADLAASLTRCGTPFDTTLINFGGLLSGSIEVMNDSASYHVIIREPYGDYKISRVEILHGTQQYVINNIVGLIDCNTLFPRNPPTVVNYSPEVDSTVVISIPFGADNCMYMHAHIRLTKRDAAGNELHSFWIWSNGTNNPSQNPCQQYFRYCRQSCSGGGGGGDTIPPVDTSGCGPLRTQTQGGWGAPPNGNNNGVYLHANFAAAFPSGLKVGCAGGHTLHLTSAQAVTNLLPAGGTPKPLTQSYTDPVNIKNNMVAQLVALTLNVTFDRYDANFGQAARKLETMYIKKGKFKGMTVAQFLDIANKELGKCTSQYKASDISETATKINENYTDGNTNKGFLVCHLHECDDDDDDDDD